jgi:lactoylglutathione lyase
MTHMPRASGLFETHLTVSDLERSIAFYRDTVGLSLALEVQDRAAAFFWIGAPGRGMLGLWSLGSAPMGLSLHIAVEASLADVLGACAALRANEIVPLSFFGTETMEPSVIGWMPAAAVYFRDPDGHLIEYLAMLPDPPRAQLGIVSWSEWQTQDPTSGTVRVERYAGARHELRPLFAEAEDSAQELDGYIDTGEVLVAVADDQVIGHLQLIDDHEGNGSEIKNMAVDATRRGRGIGRLLVEGAIDMARSRGRRTLAVGTAAADTGNLRFYQRAGFRLREIERDAFIPAAGYPDGLMIDGICLRDRVWLDLELEPARS